MICKGCGQDRKLVKSHIIPESFFRGLRDGQKAPKIHSNTPGIYPKRSPVGVYDSNILCSDCENIFDDIDSYGYEVLINRESDHEPLYNRGKLVGYKISEIDHSRLKLFFMSILWRASISGHEFYSKVNLGPLEEQLKELVFQKNPGSNHQYSYVLSRFEGDLGGRTILDPHPEKWDDVNYYRFYLYGYILYIKVDSRVTPEKWAEFISNGDELIIISRGNIKDSKEYPILLSAAKN